MKLKKLPPQCIAPLRLKEITLHGIGSYYKPARLEIKPLTILCGTNGSGKSTWMKVLSALKESLGPVRDDDGKVIADFLQRLNRVAVQRNLLNARLDDNARSPTGLRDGWNDYYGPVGSFSVTFACVTPVKLENAQAANGSVSADDLPLLHLTELKRNDVVRMRFTQCRFGHPTNFHRVMTVRVSVNGEFVELRASQPKNAKKARITLHAGIESDAKLASRDKHGQSVEQTTDNYEALVALCEQLVRHCFVGYFKISAIRNIVDSYEKGTEGEEDFSDADLSEVGPSRYVGANGQHTHFFRHYFSVTPVFDPRKGFSYCGTVTEDDVLEPIVKQYEERKAYAPPKQHKAKRGDLEYEAVGPALEPWSPCYWILFQHTVYWQYLYDHHREKLQELAAFLKALPPDVTRDDRVQHFLMDFFHAMKTGVFHGIDDHLPTQCAVICDQFRPLGLFLIGNLFKRPDYFRWFLSEVEKGSFEDITKGTWVSGKGHAWARFLASRPDAELHPDDIATLNQWALSWSSIDCASGNTVGLRFQSLFGWWADKLLSVKTHVGKCCSHQYLHAFVGERAYPVGYLSSSTPSENEYDGSGVDETRRWSYSNRLLAGNDHEQDAYEPGCFSAGLHQVAPILVQMSMMRMNEVLAVENPEVHLHPGLQLKFTEFFIENALVGKFSLIETHSDLMIRRIMRAITEEHLPQSWVNISFVDIEQVDEKGDILTSKVDQLKLDERGMVSNWPKDFLDDDERETKALMKALYGDRYVGEDEEVDHE